MKTAPRFKQGLDGQSLATGLLSIDADAHLQKLTAHMFPSPALLPVELVRSALKRMAAAVAVQITAERIVISDNGAGISAAEWEALTCLADASQTPVAREKAMAILQEPARPGIGLLAVFYPGARSLQIENVNAGGRTTLRIAAGRIERQGDCAMARGTRITIFRRRGPVAEEKTLLSELCASARAEIFINGGKLKNKPLLTEALVSLDIAFGENTLPSALSVPVQGDVCRIWLLDQGIPWQLIAMAPVQGLLFSAALETGSRPTPAAIQTLAAQAVGLYRWLAENYGQFPERFQSRIDDLFFRQARSGPDLDLLSLCAPFRLWHSSRRLNLAEVRRQAASGSLYFSDHNSRPDRFVDRERDVLSSKDRPISSARIGGRSVLPCEDRPISSARIGGRSVLMLTARQKDFLFNHLHLPMVNLNAQREIKRRPWKLRDFCRRKIAGIERSIAALQTEIPGEEKEFCRELELHWQRKREALAPEAGVLPLSVVMIEGRGLLPAFWQKNTEGEVLLIRRRHPLTLRVLQKFNQDQDNCELAFAALMPAHFLTDREQ